jgi:hypothetical protein
MTPPEQLSLQRHHVHLLEKAEAKCVVDVVNAPMTEWVNASSMSWPLDMLHDGHGRRGFGIDLVQTESYRMASRTEDLIG